MSHLFDTLGADTMALGIGLLITLTWFVGYGSGKWHARTASDDALTQGTIAQACLAILGLLLAFTFSAAYTKFETRRESVVREAISIGTFWTRAELLPEPVRSATKQHLKDYVQLHLDLAETGLDIAATRRVDLGILTIQNTMIEDVVKVLQQPDNRIMAMPIMASFNDMLDQYEIRAAARIDHVPFSVVLLLLIVSMICAFVLGRSQGVALQRRPWVTTMFLIMVVFIIYITFDLDQPWYGLSRTSQVPMIRLARSIGVTP